MKLSNYAHDIMEYDCNICGQRNSEPVDRFHRELTACLSCGSNPRFRGIVHALCHEIFAGSQTLDTTPSNFPISGIGLSDSECYAHRLKRIFAYQNTYFDNRPQLDVTTQSSCERYLPVDFVVCSEVFEHVLPPVQRAFDNLRLLLRPGGLLVFSVPTIEGPETVEHFPDFHIAQVIKLAETHVLLNRTRRGDIQLYQDIFFHGGPGAVLELRVFGQDKLVQHLIDASFTDIRVYDTPIPEIGYYWGRISHDMQKIGSLLGYVLTARAA
jgi:SAM-dependent methyltransferase